MFCHMLFGMPVPTTVSSKQFVKNKMVLVMMFAVRGYMFISFVIYFDFDVNHLYISEHDAIGLTHEVTPDKIFREFI